MRYNVEFDQEFVTVYGMSITEVLCLSTCITLNQWAQRIVIGDKEWCWYTEGKMVEEYPAIYGCEKRVYKNLNLLAKQGYIELTKLGKKKLLRITEKCQFWMRPKEDKKSADGQNKTTSGLNVSDDGQKKSADGQNKTTSGLFHIYDDNITIDNNNKNNNINKNDIKENSSIKEVEESSCGEPHAPLTSGDTLFADVVIEKETFGLTPSQVGVTKKTFDNVTAKIQQLQFPTNADDDFKRKFVILACSPKWQKKTIPSLQMNIKKLSEYDLEFASELIDKSIAGGWQGVVFSNTPEEYKKWKDNRFKGIDGRVNYDAIKEYLNKC